MEKKRFSFRRILPTRRSWSNCRLDNMQRDFQWTLPNIRQKCLHLQTPDNSGYALRWVATRFDTLDVFRETLRSVTFNSNISDVFLIFGAPLFPFKKGITQYFQRTLWHFQLPFSLAISSAVFPRLDLAVVSAPFAIKYLTTSSFPGYQFN